VFESILNWSSIWIKNKNDSCVTISLFAFFFIFLNKGKIYSGIEKINLEDEGMLFANVKTKIRNT
jgi:hypothetical protein